ncbi:hypothetical protein ACHAWF_014737 [Thalassiosira exigua]
MPCGTVYRSKEDDLGDDDQAFVQGFRSFHETLRKQNECLLKASSATEHRSNVRLKKMSVSVETQNNHISELLRYHGWACMHEESIACQVSLKELILSGDDLFLYCKFLLEERGIKEWTLNKTYQAVIGMVKFMAAKGFIKEDAANKLLEDTRVMYNDVARSSNWGQRERPSLCERRDCGEALNFHDIVKVCVGQLWRVRALWTFAEQNNLTVRLKKRVREMLLKEMWRLAVMVTLLKYPTRKVEVQRSIVERAGGTRRLKLSAKDRKTGSKPIDVKLTTMEVKIFNFLRNATMGAADADAWHPFKDKDVTSMLKATTFEMTGVGVTVTDLRSAAESHVDILRSDGRNYADDMQKALSHAEGHSLRMAQQFYKRNGSETIMRAWTSYVDRLLNIRSANRDSNSMDKIIMQKIKKSQEQWVKEVQKRIWNAQKPVNDNSVHPEVRKKRAKWTVEQDNELKKGIRIYGEGNWKQIYENSEILQERYKGSSVKKAREGCKDRWRKILNVDEAVEKSYPPHQWTSIEDSELELAVSIHGTNWKKILEESKRFQEMFDHRSDERAREALRDRYRRINDKDDKNPMVNKWKKRGRNVSLDNESKLDLQQSKDRKKSRVHRRKKWGRNASLKKESYSDLHQWED